MLCNVRQLLFQISRSRLLRIPNNDLALYFTMVYQMYKETSPPHRKIQHFTPACTTWTRYTKVLQDATCSKSAFKTVSLLQANTDKTKAYYTYRKRRVSCICILHENFSILESLSQNIIHSKEINKYNTFFMYLLLIVH